MMTQSQCQVTRLLEDFDFSTAASTLSGDIDSPSLPGSTLSPLTGSSPAFVNGNGINAKTPRIPFSPYNEFKEPTIVGENDFNKFGMGVIEIDQKMRLRKASKVL